MLETKDYWTIGTAVGALVISAAAFAVSLAGYRLAARRDRREIDAKAPSVQIVAPPCDGIGPWAFEFDIKNRDDEPVYLERLISDSARFFELHNGLPYQVSLARLTDRSALNFVSMKTNLLPGATLKLALEADGFDGKRVPSSSRAVFELEYRQPASATQLQRRSFAVILNS